MRAMLVICGALLVSGAYPAQSQEEGSRPASEWRKFADPDLGTRVDIPTGIFSVPDGPSHRGTGQQLKTTDGRAVLAVYSQANDERDTPASYLQKNFKEPLAALDYRRVTSSFFVVSGVKDGTIYYSRCNISYARRGRLHCFDLKYPASEKRAWDAIVTRISRSLRPLAGR
jgi:hypothetical protein